MSLAANVLVLSVGPALGERSDSSSSRPGLMTASLSPARVYQKMASETGCDSPDDSFDPGMLDVVPHTTASDQRGQSAVHSTHALADLLASGPSVELVGTELYDIELQQHLMQTTEA